MAQAQILGQVYRPAAVQVQEGLSDVGALLGDRDAYIRVESQWEAATHEDPLFAPAKITNAETTKHRVKVTYEDKSVSYFTLIVSKSSKINVEDHASYLIQSFVNEMKLDSVIFEVEGSNTAFFTTNRKAAIRPGGIRAFVKKSIKSTADFLFGFDDEY